MLLIAALLLVVACDATSGDDQAEGGEPAAQAEPPPPSPTPAPTPAPTPTPTPTPAGPDDDGWAEHLGLTEEELERRRASDDFLEFAEARRARNHPRFDATHGAIGIRLATEELPGLDDGEWVSPLNRQTVASDFFLHFRDTLLAEDLRPAEEVTITSDRSGDVVEGGYVGQGPRNDMEDRQILIAVAFYRDEDDRPRGRVAMAAANVQIIDPERLHATLDVVEVDERVADAAVGDDWSRTYQEVVLDIANSWHREYK